MNDAERDEFMQTCEPVGLEVQDGPMLVALTKRFSSGSVGWYASGRIVVQNREVQFNICLTVVGSAPGWVSRKERTEQNGTAPKTAPAAPPQHSPLFPGSEPSKKRRKRS